MKTGGGNRVLKTGSKEYTARELEVKAMRESGLYSEVYFDKSSGGYYAVEKSDMAHKAEEYEAARFLANKGYKMILKDESGGMTTPDGKIFKYSFDQITPEGSTPSNIRNALVHAREKKADVALVYMKHNKHTKKSVVEGLKLYEAKNGYRFKQIIVVTPDGRIHKHRHN